MHVLSWIPDEFAATHDVYFGTAFDAVSNASVADPGGVLAGPGLTDTSFDPGRLELGQTYYWRVDEVSDGEWHHAALVVLEGANLRVPNATLYIDGRADGVNAGDDDLYNLTPGEDVSIGRRATSNDRFFPGSIDEVRIFDRALSAAEVAGLADRTEPFDKP